MNKQILSRNNVSHHEIVSAWGYAGYRSLHRRRDCPKLQQQHLRKKVIETNSKKRLVVKAAQSEPLSGDLRNPHLVVQDCLASLRKADLSRLEPMFAGPFTQQVLRVGNMLIEERGPLATCARYMCSGARRTLPGHLLRRSRVLSSLYLGPDSFQQRTGITACTGEEAVLTWSLIRRGEAWFVASVQRDEDNEDSLPTAPHPRMSPEGVVLAQLAALQRGDIHSAAQFTMAPPASANGVFFMCMMAQHKLLNLKEARLGPSALPTQRQFLQQVEVAPCTDVAGANDGSQMSPQVPQGGLEPRRGFVWRLCMRDSGSWMVIAIESCPLVLRPS
eukprot:jgi/Botrbrau1/12832/Bobra.0045s0003.1